MSMRLCSRAAFAALLFVGCSDDGPAPLSEASPLTQIVDVGERLAGVVAVEDGIWFYAQGERQALSVIDDAWVLNLPRDTARGKVLSELARRRLADARLTPAWQLDDVWSSMTLVEAPQSVLTRVLGPELAPHLQRVFRDASHTPVVPSDRIVVRFAETLEGDPAAVVANALGGVPLTQLRDGSWVLRAGGDAIAAANRVQESGLAAFAEPDLGRSYELRWAPEDPYYALQWHLESRGDTGAKPGADINAEAAWDITRGTPEVVIAIIDSGVDPAHEDLDACKLLQGYDAVLDAPGGADTGNHGTACAGVAAARGNNGKGVVGACPSCRILPIHIALGSSEGLPSGFPGYAGIAFDTHIARAFFEAIDRGAAIISNSWGPSVASGPRALPSLGAAAIDLATTEGRAGLGAVVMFAAGNEAAPVELDGWATHPGVMAIAATNDQDKRAAYSNYGTFISVSAPSSGTAAIDGAKTTGIWTTDRSGHVGYNVGLGLRTVGDAAGDYMSRFGGTSSATPLTAGVAGLILSVDRSLSGAAVRAILEATAVKIDPEDGAYDDDGFSLYYGYGRIDAAAALEAALSGRASAAIGDACGRGCATCVPDAVFGDYCSSACVAGGCPDGYTCTGEICVREAPCTTLPEVCNGLDDDGNGQTDETCGGPSCGDETRAGRCDGDSAVFCDGAVVARTDCAELGGACEIEPSTGWAHCRICPVAVDLEAGPAAFCAGEVAITCQYRELFGVVSEAGAEIEACPERCIVESGRAFCGCDEPELDSCVDGDRHTCSGTETRVIACDDGCEEVGGGAGCVCNSGGIACDAGALTSCDERGGQFTATCPEGCGDAGGLDDCVCDAGVSVGGTCTAAGDVERCVSGTTHVFACPDACVLTESGLGGEVATCACDGVPEEGACEDDVAVNCRFGYVTRSTCANGCGIVLAPDGESVVAGCLCEGMAAAYECDGGDVRICLSNGDITTVACSVIEEGTDTCVTLDEVGDEGLPVSCQIGEPVVESGPEAIEVVEAGPDVEPVEDEVEAVEVQAEVVEVQAEVVEPSPKPKDEGCAGASAGMIGLGLMMLLRRARRCREGAASVEAMRSHLSEYLH